MNKLKEQMPVRYKRLDSGQGTDSNFERSLDLIFSPGCFTVEIDHSAKDVGLPIDDCGEEHYLVGNLVVTDSGTAGHKQENRVTGQQLTITSRKGKETKVFTRTFAGGVWSQWRSLARTGMYDNISTPDELLATVESLVNENTRAKEVEEEVKCAAVDISSLACTAGNENVTITGKSMDGEVLHSVEIPAATTEQAGVMSADDKKRLNECLTISPDLNLEIGSINPNDGTYIINSNRARNANFLRPPLYVKTNDDYLIIHALKYNKDKQFLGNVLINGQEVNISENNDDLYKLTFKRIDNAVFNLNDVIADSKTSIVKQVDDLQLQVESVSNEVSSNSIKIEELSPLKQIAEKIIINGVLPTSRNFQNLLTLSDGNVGSEQVSEFPTTTYFRITNTWADTHKYVLSAAVVEISNPSLLGFNTQTAVSLNCNYNTDNRYKNNICQELVRLDENIYLLYDLSGKCVNGNGAEVLPTTSYIRVSANTDVTIRIKKFYCAAVDYNGDITRYRECLISTALADYVWKDTLVSYKAVIDRNLSAGIAFWGSSSTEGDWVKNVAANLDMPYYWGGVGGENIWAIMGRMGVLPLRIETPITIPASASEAVELPNNYNLKVKWKGVYKDAKIWVSSSVSPEKLLVNPCYIAGVKGNLIGSGSSNGLEPLQFQRHEDGEAVTTKAYEPIYTLGFRETRDCVWFLACHFNGGQSSTEELVELYKKMYDVSESKKVLILGRHKVANGTVTSPTLAELQEQENALEDEFGLMFFNTREYMCGKGFERYKELYPANYTTADVEQASQGVTPDCMYESAANVHFNTRGYAVLTEGITNVLVQLGYNLFRLGGDKKHPVY